LTKLNRLSPASLLVLYDLGESLFHYRFFAVLADCLNAFAVGAPEDPAFLMRSPLPALMRFFFALMLEYSPCFM